MNLKGFFIGVAASVFVFSVLVGGALFDRAYDFKFLDVLLKRENGTSSINLEQRVLTEESIVVDVAERVSPSVVTVSIERPRRSVLEFDPFGGLQRRVQGGEPQDIGSGFIVSSEGLIVTNKHVVDTPGATYTVITNDEQEYEVKEISLDPSNDIAIIKIDPSTGSGQVLRPVELGDTEGLRVGQFVIAIGTALGEFRHTVTTGVVSGLGRGITAGSPFQGFVERLDNVIQTDAAINPGNSGGPLLNSAGQVIGVNAAIASGAENIGFAIPIEIVKRGLTEFEENGRFAAKPFLGIQYQMLTREAALLNEVPRGAYIMEVVGDSPAAAANIQPDDIITKIDDVDLNEDRDLASVIEERKVGDTVSLEIFRDGESLTLSVTLSEFGE